MADEMVGWHHRLDGHEFEQVPGVGDGEESDTTERMNCTDGCAGSSLQLAGRRQWQQAGLRSCGAQASHGSAFSYCYSQALELWLSSLEACAIFLGQGLNPFSLQGDH